MKIKSLSQSYVFFDDETRKKITYELLIQAKEQFTKDIEYYKRLQFDIQMRIDELNIKVGRIKLREPSETDRLWELDNERLKQEKRDLGMQTCSLYDFRHDIFDKCMHAERQLELVYHILPLFVTK